MHNQRPSSQLHQSSHCFGGETAIVAPFQNWDSKESIGQNQSNADEILADIAMSAIGPKRTFAITSLDYKIKTIDHEFAVGTSRNVRVGCSNGNR